MKITRVEHFRIELPRRRHHRGAATGPRSVIGRYTIVRVDTDSGISGLGEATVLPHWGGENMRYYGETNETVASVIDQYLSKIVVGQDPFGIQKIDELMDSVIVGYPYTKAAINMALYDIVGKSVNLPVYRLLGAGGCSTKIPIAHSIGLMDTDTAVDEAEAAVTDGIKTIKLKVGVDPKRDVDLVRRVRERIGSQVRITVDANKGYAIAKLAIRTIQKMEPFEVEVVEQPVESLEAMAEVRLNVKPLIMADESAWTPQDVLNIYKYNAADAISIYTTKPGGLTKASKVAAIAEAARFLCNVNGSAETGIGTAANLHLAASSPAISLPSVFPITNLEGREQTNVAGKFYLDDIVKKPFKYEDGCLLVPDEPGLGFELDDEKVRKYLVT